MLFNPIYLLFLFVFAISSCSFDTDDGASKEEMTVESTVTSSLACINDSIVPFFELDSEERTQFHTDKMFDCIDHAINIVDKHVNVESKKAISVSDIKRLVQGRVDNYTDTVDTFIDLYFSLSHIILRGTKDMVTHDELKKSRKVLKELNPVYALLQSSFNKINASKEGGESSDLSPLMADLTKLEKRIYNLFQDYEITIDKKEILNLAMAFGASGDVKELVGLFFSLKEKFIKDNKNKIAYSELDQLRVVVTDLSKTYGILQSVFAIVSKDSRQGDVSDHQVEESIEDLSRAKTAIRKIFIDHKLILTKSEIEGWLRTLGKIDLFSFSEVAFLKMFSASDKDVDAEKKWELYWDFHEMLWRKEKDRLSYQFIDNWLSGTKTLFTATIRISHQWTLRNYIYGRYTQDVLHVIDELLVMLSDATQFSNNKTLSYAEINNLLDSYAEVFEFPRDLSVTTVKNLLPVIFEKMIGVSEEIKFSSNFRRNVYGDVFKPYFAGFTHYHLTSLEKMYGNYRSIQMEIISGTMSANSEYSDDFAAVKNDFVGVINSILGYFPAENEFAKRYDEQEYGIVFSKDKQDKFNFRNLTLFNLFNSFAKSVAYGYNNTDRIPVVYDQISVDQITQFIIDFEKFFEQIYLMEKRSSADMVAGRIYLESKLFTSSGDGFKFNKVQDKTELTNVKRIEALETMSVYSSSVYTYNQIYEELLEVCNDSTKSSLTELPVVPALKGDDTFQFKYEEPIVFNKKPITKECFNNHFLKHLVHHIDNMPSLKQFIQGYILNKDLDILDQFEALDEMGFSLRELDEKIKNGQKLTDQEAEIHDKFLAINREYNLLDSLVYSGQDIVFLDKLAENSVQKANYDHENPNELFQLSIENNPYVTKADFGIMGTLLYFIESAMMKYDLDNNSVIDLDEVNNSYLYLKELIVYKGHEKCTDAAFRYILLANTSTSKKSWYNSGSPARGYMGTCLNQVTRRYWDQGISLAVEFGGIIKKGLIAAKDKAAKIANKAFEYIGQAAINRAKSYEALGRVIYPMGGAVEITVEEATGQSDQGEEGGDEDRSDEVDKNDLGESSIADNFSEQGTDDVVGGNSRSDEVEKLENIDTADEKTSQQEEGGFPSVKDQLELLKNVDYDKYDIESMKSQARLSKVENARNIMLENEKENLPNLNKDGNISVDHADLLEILAFIKKN